MSAVKNTQTELRENGTAVSDREFALFQRLIHEKAGICLSPAKKALLEARLVKRLRELGMGSFKAYYQYVMDDDQGAELVHLLDRVSTNATHFFREPAQFEYLEQKILPAWIAHGQTGERARQIHVWSAGCSTGEEPYSIAMILADRFGSLPGWEIEIVATDLSTRVLAAARAAVWPIAKAEEIPPNYLKRYMLKGVASQAGKMKAGPEIRSMIRFERVNLNDDRYPISGPFDLIFCRNVLIYFDAHSRAGVIERLLDHLAPGGLLFVGHAESLSGVTNRARYVMPTVYENATDRGALPSQPAAGRAEVSVVP